MDQQELERIARKALQELGVTATALSVVAAEPGVWNIECSGERTIKVKCGRGTTPQWVREQIFDQVLSR